MYCSDLKPKAHKHCDEAPIKEQLDKSFIDPKNTKQQAQAGKANCLCSRKTRRLDKNNKAVCSISCKLLTENMPLNCHAYWRCREGLVEFFGSMTSLLADARVAFHLLKTLYGIESKKSFWSCVAFHFCGCMNSNPQNMKAFQPYGFNSTLKMIFKDAGFNIDRFLTNDDWVSAKPNQKRNKQ